MKKLLLFGLTICVFITTFFNGFSQKERMDLWFNKNMNNKTIQFETNYPYSLTVVDRNYTHLENPVSVTDSILWDDPQYRIPVGFDFEFMGLSVDTLVVSDSYVGLDFALVYDENWDQFYYEVYAAIDIFGADLIDFGAVDNYAQSHINYELSGEPGTQILKIEWKNAGFYNEYNTLNSNKSFVYFQLWLFEKDNHFEMRYGPSYIENEALCFNHRLGPFVDFGRVEGDYETIHGYYLDGQPANPGIFPISFDFNETLDDVPANGTSYFFTVGEGTTVGLPEVEHKQLCKIYPNPSNGVFRIDLKQNTQAQIQVFDILGNKILEQQIESKAMLDISDVPRGTYIVHVLADNRIVSTQKVIKN